MKIPHKASKFKLAALSAGTIALVGGVATPFAVYAHGGGGHDTTSNRGNSQSRAWSPASSKSASNDSDKKSNHDKKSWMFDDRNYWSFLGWRGWDNLSADQFADRNAKLLAKIRCVHCKPFPHR